MYFARPSAQVFIAVIICNQRAGYRCQSAGVVSPVIVSPVIGQRAPS